MKQILQLGLAVCALFGFSACTTNHVFPKDTTVVTHKTVKPKPRPADIPENVRFSGPPE